MSRELSLRSRLSIALICAVGALAIAIFVVQAVAAQTELARHRSATATAQTIARALHGSDRSEQAARAAIGSLDDVMAGFCTREGQLLAYASTGPRGDANRRPIPPDLEGRVRELCARPVPPRSPVAEASRSIWMWPVVVLAIAIVILALDTLRVLRALRIGVGSLETTLGSLERDLGAPVERPRIRELNRTAEGLRRMASRVAAGRARERALETRLAHEQRLVALGRVVAGVAHEVRNPLAGIKLRLDVVARGTTATPDVIHDVTAALGEVARLDRLVTSLLSVARRSAPEAIQLDALVDERLALLASWAGPVHLVREGDAQLTSDRDALCRAIDNLVRNAVEASAPGKTVTVAITRGDADIQIDVRDCGAGLAPNVELFEPFNTSKAGGVGLGTFIARSLIAGIGGDITYAREEPWTRFRITLPIS